MPSSLSWEDCWLLREDNNSNQECECVLVIPALCRLSPPYGEPAYHPSPLQKKRVIALYLGLYSYASGLHPKCILNDRILQESLVHTNNLSIWEAPKEDVSSRPTWTAFWDPVSKAKQTKNARKNSLKPEDKFYLLMKFTNWIQKILKTKSLLSRHRFLSTVLAVQSPKRLSIAVH